MTGAHRKGARRSSSAWLVAAVAILVITPSLLAARVSMEGRWVGTISTPHGSIPFQLVVGHDGPAVTGSFALSGAEGAELQPVRSIEVHADSLVLSVPLTTNLGTALMRMRGVREGAGLAGDFETLTDEGLTVGSGTWRLERSGGGGVVWEGLPDGEPVSTAESHEGPSFFDEKGGRFYFTRVSRDFSSSRVLFVAGTGEAPATAPFSTGPYDAGLTRAPGGGLWIFTSKRPTRDKTYPDEWNLWGVQDGGSPARPLPAPVNSPASECCAAFAPDGSFLFSSDRAGSWDIYRAVPGKAGGWTVALLQGTVNSEGDEWPSWVSPDGDMVLFNSMREGGFGGDDLFAACREGGEDRWAAVRLPESVNTAGYEDSGMITPDGRTYFWSGRRRHAQGTADILSMDADRVGLPECGAAGA